MSDLDRRLVLGRDHRVRTHHRRVVGSVFQVYRDAWEIRCTCGDYEDRRLIREGLEWLREHNRTQHPPPPDAEASDTKEN